MSRNIVLIGMPGSGKSTIGYRLSKQLKLQFLDADIYIEKKEKNTINGLFEKGEQYFRDIESKYIADISKLSSTIIATGGGVIKREKNMQLLKSNSIIIYIDRKVSDIICDVDGSIRPLIGNKKENLYNLYEERKDLYMKYCDYKLKNNTDLDSIVEEIKNIYLKEELK